MLELIARAEAIKDLLAMNRGMRVGVSRNQLLRIPNNLNPAFGTSIEHAIRSVAKGGRALLAELDSPKPHDRQFPEA